MKIMRTLLDETSSAQSRASPPPVAGSAHPLSPWHSPVPYLFGGLAATLGLIALALLILACSYWNVSGNPGEGGLEEGGDAEKGEAEKVKEATRVYEEKIVVIMAGDEKPTYLAMPVGGRGRSSVGCDRKSVDQETRKEADGFGSKVNEDDGNNNCTDEVADHHHHREVQESQ